MSDEPKGRCYKCQGPVEEGQVECEMCARGIPPEMRQQAEQFMRGIASIKFAEIDWEKIKSMPVDERINALMEIMGCAIPGVVVNSPQYFQIFKYLKR